MNKKTIIATVTLLIIVSGLLMPATLRADDYKEFAEQVRKEVWAWDRPEFKNYDVPEKYKNESAVILAVRTEINATGKSNIRYRGGLSFVLNKELNYSKVYRRMIFINDKKTLDENSEISYTEEETGYGRRSASKFRKIVGARIIKPDRSINEVNMEEAVSITKGKKNKDDYKKIAIPDLQVGDILDYFIYEDGRMDNRNIPPNRFILSQNYPISSYSIHCEIDKNMTVEYRPINGAPDFKESQNEDGDYLLDFEAKDLPKNNATNWISPVRQLPMVRLAIYYNSNKKIYKPKSHRDKGIYKNVDPNLIVSDAFGRYDVSVYYVPAWDAWREIKKQAKTHFNKYPTMDNKAKANYLQESLLCYFLEHFTLSQESYIESLRLLFYSFKIEHQLGLVNHRFLARPEEAFIPFDFEAILVANNGTQFFVDPYFAYSKREYVFANEPVQTIQFKKIAIQSETGLKGKRGKTVFPSTTATDNQDRTTLQVDFSKESPLTLMMEREEVFSGSTRRSPYANAIIMTDYRNELAKSVERETELDKLMKKNKKNEIDSYHAALEKEIKERDQTIKNLLADEYSAEVKELIEYSYPQVGATIKKPEVIFKAKYAIDGLVKRAGNNYTLDVGKLITSQVVVEEKDRNRTIDAYIESAKTYRHDITIRIPENYAVEGIQKLNQSVDNEYGKFKSTASVDGNTLTIAVEKVYKNHLVPASGWSQLVEMLDAANVFYGQSVVLRKK